MKKTRTERILEPFGAKQGANLIDFFDTVADFECDAVVFMARKSLCLYRMMVLCGARKIRAQVFSDSILDDNSGFLSGKRVLIVDDTLFVGTTLSDAAARLKECGVASRKFWVYCVDADTWKSKTFSPDFIYTRMSAQETIEFCAAECRALINAGIPYLTDFAASQRIRMTPNELDDAIKPVNWTFHDVSSQYHEQCRVKYYSALPDQLINERIKDVIGNSIFSLIEIAKIRVFATWAGNAYDVTLVPVVTFAPFEAKELPRVAGILAKTFSIEKASIVRLSVKEQMRLVQFLVGSAFMKAYWEHLDRLKPVDLEAKLSFEWCQTVFPPKIAEEIATQISTFYNTSNEHYSVKGRVPNLSKGEPKSIVQETKSDIDYFLASYFSEDEDVDFGHTPLSDLTAIMLEFQRKFENAARKEIVENVPNPKYRDRLKRGMAWRALCAHLLSKYSAKNTRYNRNILALVLDRLIDFGIAVPIISEIDGLIYRAYRHGEDVKFGAQEESLAYEILDGFQVGRGVEGIESTYLEKILVILLRVGMNEEWLNLWYSNTGRDNLARIGYYLQGAVPIIPRSDDELVPEGESSWLTRRLGKTGMLRRRPASNNQNSKYTLGSRPEAAHARSGARRTAKSLGITVGKACVHGARTRSVDRPLATDDLIILTSCSNPIDTVGAVAAELHLFGEWFNSSGFRVFRGNLRAPKSESFRIKIRGSHGEIAVNSALWKLEKFQESAITDVRAKVEKLAEVDNEYAMREGFWAAIFDAFHREVNSVEQEKIDRFLNSSSGILKAAVYIMETMKVLSKIGRGALNKESILGFCALVDDSENLDPAPPSRLLEAGKSLASSIEESKGEIISALDGVAQELEKYGRFLASQALEEAAFGSHIVIKANTRLTKTEYRYMVWYDILDVRVRKQETADLTDSYSKSVDKFRNEVSRLLYSLTETFRESGGAVFVDTGEIRSRNDEKHIFFSGKGSMIQEANQLVCDIKRLAEISGVRLRIMALPTNLRGEYVYLNRGTTSIDGDFKSHAHTLIQSIAHHQTEESLGDGDCVVWVLDKQASSFRCYGSGTLTRVSTIAPISIVVNIRGIKVTTSICAFL